MTEEQRHGFDFCTGSWDVANRRRTTPLSEPAEDEWEEFTSHAETWMALGGGANLDEITFPQGHHGLTLRLYDPNQDQWTLNWVDSRTGRLDPPLTGRFGSPGRGEFFGTDVYAGRPVEVRFVWSRTDTDSPQWEQSFRLAGSSDWEVNWVMTLRRPQA